MAESSMWRPQRASARPLGWRHTTSARPVLALSETLAAELSGTDVNVTVLCPTFVKTNIANNPQIDGRLHDSRPT